MVPMIEMSLSGKIEEVASVLDDLEIFCTAERVPTEIATRLGVILDELITNTIMHGLKDQSNPQITLMIQKHNGALNATIWDNGIAFNPLETKLEHPSGDTHGIEDMKVGGLGIMMARSFADNLDYRHEDDLNKISIEIKIP